MLCILIISIATEVTFDANKQTMRFMLILYKIYVLLHGNLGIKVSLCCFSSITTPII